MPEIICDCGDHLKEDGRQGQVVYYHCTGCYARYSLIIHPEEVTG